MSSTERRAEAKRRLLVDSVTLEVVVALRDAGVQPLLLKGPAIASWIYRSGEARPYVDSDLLVSPADFDAACSTLTSLGFTRILSDLHLEDFAEPHAQTWHRAEQGVAVDLHWRIPGVGASPALAWPLLSENPGLVQIGMTEIEALAPPARALHLALHAIQNGRQDLKSTQDLEFGLNRLDFEVWSDAAALAEKVDAADPFAVAMTMVPDGAAVSARLGITAPSQSVWHLWASTPPPGAVRLHSLASIRSKRRRARMALAAAFPSPDFMRASYPFARRGRVHLGIAYGRRFVTGLLLLPRAWRAVGKSRGSGTSR